MIEIQYLYYESNKGNIAILEDFDDAFVSVIVVDKLGRICENDIMLSCSGYLNFMKEQT